MRAPNHLRCERADDLDWRRDVARDPILRERHDLEDHFAALLFLRLRVDGVAEFRYFIGFEAAYRLLDREDRICNCGVCLGKPMLVVSSMLYTFAHPQLKLY